MTVSDQPVATAEEVEFQHLLRILKPLTNFQLSTGIHTELLNMYNQMKTEVKRVVGHAQDLVLTAELWVCTATDSYLTVTCHLINENWDLQSYTLETAHLLDNQSADYIVQQLVRIAKDWAIKEKIHVIVTNIKHMRTACEKAGWIHISCFAHTLDVVFKEAMATSTWEDLLKKCRAIVKFFHQDPGATQKLQEKQAELNLPQRELVQSTHGKWLPTLHMLERLSEQWPAIHEVSKDRLIEELWFYPQERQMLHSAVQALMSLREVVEEVGQHGFNPISNIIPLVDKLQVTLGEMRENKVAEKLAEKCDYHFGSIKNNTWLSISTALDPKFKSYRGLREQAEKIKAKIQHLITGSTSHQRYHEQAEYDFFVQMDTASALKPLQFWASQTEFKSLYKIALKYLTVVSTAIPMERVLQMETSQTVAKWRCSLEPQYVSLLVFLNTNCPTVRGVQFDKDER
ncbi:zinc finger BED domain-containing protein 4 [Chanos chanos]|uniref:Zinc finger BED domain-containing protein 4 n=1 Tax=Chanos chanos TaxID=29144 RepID=A0A6J2VFK6_CHACN|nr:zinc finger BED domain-containing protein 4-like [Chanos chanos]